MASNNVNIFPIDNVTIQNWRGIKELHMKNIGDINILIGKNNVGKTSLLEAIYLEDID